MRCVIYLVVIYQDVTEVHVSDPGALLPLSHSVFYILLALADEDRHGYAIMRDIEDRTDGVVRVGPGTLYGSIKWLLADGFIAASPARPKTDDDERRRY